MSSNIYITIMAGGVGSRFWPSSTEETPKQFLDILGVGKSLLRLTFERFLNIVDVDKILIVTNRKYKNLTIEHLPELPEENILCEPSRNDTAPCVAYTALRIHSIDPDAVFLTAPSDHIILKEELFLEKVKQALEFVSTNDAICTLGISPTRADTGYGYIETIDEPNLNVLKVKSFKEKPKKETAELYVSQGNYLWNAGIFAWKASNLIDTFHKYAAEVMNVLCEDIAQYGTSNEQTYIDRVYPNTPSISVDYAILEKANNVYTIPSDIGWSDLGTWNSLHGFLEKDENLNAVVQGSDKINLIDVTNSIIKSSSKSKRIVIKDLDDYIVVDEENALLIYPKSKEQEIKQVVKKL